MKAKLIDRILLAILLLLVIAVSLFLIMIAVQIFPARDVQQVVSNIYANPTNAIIVGAIGLVLFIVALRLMFASAGKKAVASAPMPTSTLVKANEIGSTYISLSAIDAMVQKHCRNNNRIRTIESVVRGVAEGGGVAINVRLALMPDTDIPALTDELQQTLKQYVESFSGISVREIGILVEDTSINPKSRVD